MTSKKSHRLVVFFFLFAGNVMYVLLPVYQGNGHAVHSAIAGDSHKTTLYTCSCSCPDYEVQRLLDPGAVLGALPPNKIIAECN